jgi:hypothetical protein
MRTRAQVHRKNRKKLTCSEQREESLPLAAWLREEKNWVAEATEKLAEAGQRRSSPDKR